MNNTLRLATAFIGLACVSSQAQAGAIQCSSTISSMSVDWGGTLVVGLPGIGTGAMTYLCNIGTPMATSIGTIPTEVCKTWVAQLITAQAQGKRVEFNVDYGAAAAPASCTAITGWSWAMPNPFPYWINFPTN